MRGRVRIGDDQVVELAEMFRLMSDPTRLRIILACLDAPAAVGEMAERLGISASLVSHHLRLLRAARLLGAERRGRQVFYVVGDLHIRSMLSDMVDHVAEEDAETDSSDRKSTRLNSSHANISYAVFCLKKKNNISIYILSTI